MPDGCILAMLFSQEDLYKKQHLLPDLPQRYCFYRDLGFWLTLGLSSLWGLLAWYMYRTFARDNGSLLINVIPLVVVALHVITTIWMMWDSHRWAFPLRWRLLFLPLVLFCFIWYLPLRASWLMRVAQVLRERGDTGGADSIS
jgi:hypothetical protein